MASTNKIRLDEESNFLYDVFPIQEKNPLLV